MLDQNQIDAFRSRPVPEQQLFIDGSWCDAADRRTLDVVSPIDGRVISSLASAGTADVEKAVQSARKCFSSGRWASMSPQQRKRILLRIADEIERHALELAVLGVRDNGTEISMAVNAEPGSAAATFRYYGEAIDKIYGEIAPTANGTLGMILREPAGVIGAIVPWNFPLMIAAWKIAPALAAGNSVVLKPAEEASLSLLKLAELCAAAGLPEGALNVVTGPGAVTGEALALHDQVDVLAFTGSGVVGRKLLAYAAQSNLKRVYLELGGKSPNIVFEDAADLAHVAAVSTKGIFRNSGQVCVAGSRLLLQRSIRDEFLEHLSEATGRLKVGDPLNLENAIGAVVSDNQLQKNLGWVERAAGDGATLLAGGSQILADTGGYYMQPTIFGNVTVDMPIARQEVFGPVLAIIEFDDEAEAIQQANHTNYGLASALWTTDLSRAHRMIHAIQAGVVHVNCYGGADVTVPLGGVKQSGNGVDKSLHALEKYTNLKTAWLQLD